MKIEEAMHDLCRELGLDEECFNGMPIVITDYITKTVRKRTHKKKRIDKKWLKKYGYTEVQDESKIYMFDDKLFMSKKCYDKLLKGMKNERRH